MLTDYHVHLRPDELDATAELYFTSAGAERYREAARAAGIGELGVSEHVHRFSQALTIWDHPYWREYAHDDLVRLLRVRARARPTCDSGSRSTSSRDARTGSRT